MPGMKLGSQEASTFLCHWEWQGHRTKAIREGLTVRETPREDDVVRSLSLPGLGQGVISQLLLQVVGEPKPSRASSCSSPSRGVPAMGQGPGVLVC